MSTTKVIEYEDVIDWLGEDTTVEDTVGILTDIANGVYSWEQLAEDIKQYKEHN